MASEGRQARTTLLGQSYFWAQLVYEPGAFPGALGRWSLHLDLMYLVVGEALVLTLGKGGNSPTHSSSDCLDA